MVTTTFFFNLPLYLQWLLLYFFFLSLPLFFSHSWYLLLCRVSHLFLHLLMLMFAVFASFSVNTIWVIPLSLHFLVLFTPTTFTLFLFFFLFYKLLLRLSCFSTFPVSYWWTLPFFSLSHFPLPVFLWLFSPFFHELFSFGFCEHPSLFSSPFFTYISFVLLLFSSIPLFILFSFSCMPSFHTLVSSFTSVSCVFILSIFSSAPLFPTSIFLVFTCLLHLALFLLFRSAVPACAKHPRKYEGLWSR